MTRMRTTRHVTPQQPRASSGRGTALTYWGIADHITKKIDSGELAPEEKLPSYTALAEQYQVSVSTVKRAILLLHERDVVIGAPGRGVFVRDKTTDTDTWYTGRPSAHRRPSPPDR